MDSEREWAGRPACYWRKKVNRLSGVLGDYVGIGMAATMLGKPPEHTGTVYNIINDGNLIIYKVGGVALIKAKAFGKAATRCGYKTDPPPWPEEYADLPMKNIYSRKQIADLLGLSVGTIYNLVKRGDIDALDLSRWNMSSMYYYFRENSTDRLPVYVTALGHDVKLYADGGMLVVEIGSPIGSALESLCFGPEPSKAWFMDGAEVAIEVRIVDKEKI
jgi:hypothetical protein